MLLSFYYLIAEQKKQIMNLKNYIRSINDFPKKGIVYRDITPLLLSAEARAYCVSQFLKKLPPVPAVDKVVGVESRGFFFSTLLADQLNAGLVMVRKSGKLPYKTFAASYDLEYGKDNLEIHQDAVREGENVLIHDDVLATGGTALAAANLVKRLGGNIVQFNFLLELQSLKGRNKLNDYTVESLLTY